MQATPYSTAKALSYGRDYLRKALPKVNHKLEATLLLSQATNKSKEMLTAYPEVVISNEQFEEYLSLLRRRGANEPISQIRGQKEFYSRIFSVNKQVLTPRPESELLVDLALEYLKSTPGERTIHIADFGTGSGCLAITLALELEKLKLKAIIDAFDISEKALEVARSNWESLKPAGTAQKLTFINIDLLKEQPETGYDLIITNPPYIPLPEKEKLPPDVVDYEPHEALFAGRDGLSFYKRLNELFPLCLKDNGIALIELHSPLHKKIRAVFEKEYSSDTFNDLAGLPRALRLEKILS